MLRNLKDLEKECLEKGLEVTTAGKKISKQDYIDALAKDSLSKMVVTPGLEYRLSMKSPMLSLQSDTLNDNEYNELFTHPDIVFEEKLNGNRMVVIYTPGVGFEFYSRNVSVEDYLPVCYTKHVYMSSDFKGKFKSFVIDCEIESILDVVDTSIGKKKGVVTKTKLQAVSAILGLDWEDSIAVQKREAEKNNVDSVLLISAFDCLMYDGVDFREQEYFVRKEILKNVVKELVAAKVRVRFVAGVSKDREDYLKNVWANGGEGVIAKRVYQKYYDNDSRPRTGWIKIKKTVSGSIGDSIDGWICGFDRGEPGKAFENMIGSIYVNMSLLDEEGKVIPSEYGHTIAVISGLDYELRKKLTVYNEETDEVDINKEYLGKVVEVDGQEISPRSRRLVHPRLIRFRDDKNMFECKIKESVLNSLIG